MQRVTPAVVDLATWGSQFANSLAATMNASPIAQGIWNVVLALVGGSVALVVYFFPALLAWKQGHPATVAIAVLTFFLGWTGLGWIIALVWACTPPRR